MIDHDQNEILIMNKNHADEQYSFCLLICLYIWFSLDQWFI